MLFFLIVLSVVLGYLGGSIPVGWILVKLLTGKDIREVGSGRTGGTNAFRAAGLAVGFFTALLDILKVTGAVWLATVLTNGYPLAEALAGVAGVLGHNSSIFLAKRVTTEDGKTKLQFQGGAGGASAIGGALGLWVWSVAWSLPVGLFFLFVIGYASVATVSVGLTLTIIFLVRAIFYDGPWAYILYGMLVLAMQVWALRPNFVRLFNGTERVLSISLMGKLKAQADTSITGSKEK